MRRSYVFGVVVLAAAGCNCHGNPLKTACMGIQGVQMDNVAQCESSSECGDHFNCRKPSRDSNLQCCMFDDRQCQTEADCCPGQTCPTTRKICLDKVLECMADTDCGDKGDRFCEDWVDPTFGTSKRCRFHVCGPVGECPDGQSCFQGECIAALTADDLPCGGACDPGKACVPTIDRCQDYSMPTGRPQAACPMSCMPGFIATFADARNIWDTCKLPPVKCVCAELPGLRSEDLGRFSALTVDPGKALWASSYDGQYGDLVVYKFDDSGKLISGFPEYVDGVPLDATPKFGPSGARNGVVDPGDDVGRYTDIAMGPNGTVFVSYYDVTNGNLRFAWRNAGDGKWTTVLVDGDVTDTGLYTSLAVDQDGLPGISYFQRGADSAFDATTCPAPVPTAPNAFITALKFAKASSPTPGPGDWTLTTLGCQGRPTPACYQCNDVCADPGTGAACFKAGSGGACVADGGASACDATTETCVTVGTTAQCAKKYNPSTLQDIPQGVGLFTSLAFNGKDAFIAYMKRSTPAMSTLAKGDLYGLHLGPTGAPVGTAVLLDGNGDTGYFPDVKIDPTTKHVAVSYHDFTSKALKYYSALGFMTQVTPEIIDTGTGAAGSGESDWVGTDSALVFGPNPGQLYVVYQDPTLGDLKLAKRGATAWQIMPSIATMGAVGFFADGVFENGKIFASHARIHAKLINGEPHVDNALLLDPVDAP
jgi:hypothetical protein